MVRSSQLFDGPGKREREARVMGRTAPVSDGTRWFELAGQSRAPEVCDMGRLPNGQTSEVDMPVISKFYGIVIRMLVARGLGARFHAIYGESEMVVQIEPLRIVSGNVPSRVADMVIEWAQKHQAELMRAWTSCRMAERPAMIPPLM
jgi:hypothetical protein